MQHDAHHPADPADGADALRLVVQLRDAEIQMLRLLVQKLKLQLARRATTGARACAAGTTRRSQ